MTENFLPNLDFSGKRAFRHAPGVDDKKCPVIQSTEHVCLMPTMLRKHVHRGKWLSLRNVFLCPLSSLKTCTPRSREVVLRTDLSEKRGPILAILASLSLRVSVFPQQRKDFFNTFTARALLFCAIRTAMGKKGGKEKKILEATRNEAMESNLPKERTDGRSLLVPSLLPPTAERQSNPHTYRPFRSTVFSFPLGSSRLRPNERPLFLPLLGRRRRRSRRSSVVSGSCASEQPRCRVP